MTGSSLALFISVFLACSVEAVEAVTIVLAAGTARDWKSAGRGVVAGLLTLAVIIAALGPAISQIKISVLRIVVGALLLVFGLTWLRKAILRASGHKALHDEEKIFQEEIAAARAAGKGAKHGIDDWYAFTLSFKGVVLEGLEVAFIVLTFGTIDHHVTLASIAALLAVAIVTAAGFALRAPLSRVPENTMKFVVGILLTSFGIFWAAEGCAGSTKKWPGDNWAVLGLIAFVAVVAFTLIELMKIAKRQSTAVKSTSAPAAEKPAAAKRHPVVAGLIAFVEFWIDFVLGDDWRIAAGLVVAFIITASVPASVVVWGTIPLFTAVLLSNSLARVVKSSR